MRRLVIMYQYKMQDSQAVSTWQQTLIDVDDTKDIGLLHERIQSALNDKYFGEGSRQELSMFYIAGQNTI